MPKKKMPIQLSKISIELEIKAKCHNFRMTLNKKLITVTFRHKVKCKNSIMILQKILVKHSNQLKVYSVDKSTFFDGDEKKKLLLLLFRYIIN